MELLARIKFYDLLKPQSVGLTVFLISIAAVIGLAVGSVKVRGLTLGIGGVLFAGLGIGVFLNKGDLHAEVMEFARELGLILFVYTIGVQVGPGFMASLRRQGLPLNLMALAVVLMGAALTVVTCKVGGVDMKNAVGIFSGATTNTPSLAAAQQALRDSKLSAIIDPATGQPNTSGTVAGYAVAYPFGVLGVILAMALFRAAFRVNLKAEAGALQAQDDAVTPKLATMTIEVTNANLAEREIRRIPGYPGGDVVISRLRRGDELMVASPKTKLRVGDVAL